MAFLWIRGHTGIHTIAGTTSSPEQAVA